MLLLYKHINATLNKRLHPAYYDSLLSSRLHAVTFFNVVFPSKSLTLAANIGLALFNTDFTHVFLRLAPIVPYHASGDRQHLGFI